LQRRSTIIDHRPAHALADPISARAIEPKLEQFSADLDRYSIAVVLQAVYECGGYRYTNALDAIAAAKRGRK
jgi:hypothetical protein